MRPIIKLVRRPGSARVLRATPTGIITTNNPNVFYELGIRHALQEKRTFLIRAKSPPAQTVAVEALKEAEVPFDLKTDRYFEYDPVGPESCLEPLTEALRRTAASERQDSPVFLLLPNLKPQEREGFIPVPLGFGEEVQKAEKEKDAKAYAPGPRSAGVSVGIDRIYGRRPGPVSDQEVQSGKDCMGKPAKT